VGQPLYCKKTLYGSFHTAFYFSADGATGPQGQLRGKQDVENKPQGFLHTATRRCVAAHLSLSLFFQFPHAL
jgi:hypothetical protein